MAAESPENPQPIVQRETRLKQPAVVVLAERTFPVMRTGVRRLRTVRFEMDGKGYQAIEQNPEKPSRWGKLAREGHRVVQFRDVGSGKYVAVVVNGKVTEYGR